VENLIAAARAWSAEDPDPATREELSALISRATDGDPAAAHDLTDRFSGRLQFGTAGLRGEMGAGPNRMNRVTVIRAAAGLAAFLTEKHDGGVDVAIGYDARYNSRRFAEDTAEVMAGAGHRPLLLPRALPTPILAFSVRHLGAKAGVMVTASHNPARDNGYKVYLDDGSQIAPPNDSLIAAHIDAVGSLDSVPRGDVEDLEPLPESVIEAYVARSGELIAPGSRDVCVVYTAMHGVGHEVFQRVFAHAGFPDPIVVPEQIEPDPDFPTVPFPNPEETGALDLAKALAAAQDPAADVILANDPDADRIAVAVPDGVSGGWRQLSGDDVGLILGWHLGKTRPAEAAFATTIVSSEGLGAVRRAAGGSYERTLTGFKWISKVEHLGYGYEEAIGYCCDPSHVNDKDGITAALVVADLVAQLKAEGRSLLDALAEVDAVTGNLVTAQLSLRSNDPERIQALIRRLRESPPARLGVVEVLGVEDLSVGGRGLPPEQGLRLRLHQGWIAVRPSGTEPKLKCYMEIGDASEKSREPVVARLAEAKRALDAWFRGQSMH
jgi:phosphomannomutase